MKKVTLVAVTMRTSLVSLAAECQHIRRVAWSSEQ